MYYDLAKAYDSVIHSTLIEKLKKKGIEKRVIKVIQRILDVTSIELFCVEKDLGNVQVKRGVNQGDSLSPLLFVIYIDDISQKLKGEVELRGGKKIRNHLFYMDDLKVISGSTEKGRRKSLFVTTRIPKFCE